MPLDDLAVGADLTGLQLVRLSSGRRIVPLAWNMLNPQAQVGNVGRFLRELRLSGVRPGFTWDWGPLEQAPYTPRVRYGRTVLAPARWRPSAPFFADTTLPEREWRLEFDRWRERWSVPDHVLLCVADRGLELDLSAGLHLRLLRQDVARWPEAVLREAPTGEDAYGWLSGPAGAHTAEVVFPLLADAPIPRPVPAHAHAPLCARRPRSEPSHPAANGSTPRSTARRDVRTNCSSERCPACSPHCPPRWTAGSSCATATPNRTYGCASTAIRRR